MRALLFLLALSAVPPAEAGAEDRILSEGTAVTLPKGTWAGGIFSPVRWGLLDDLELDAHPLLFFVRPHLTVKKRWLSGPFTVATRHQVAYESLLLSLFAREGTGGLLPANSEIPTLFTVSNAALATKRFAPSCVVTLLLESNLGPSIGNSDFPTVDLPIIYQHTAHLYTGYSFRAGIDVEGVVHGPLHYLVDLDLWWFPGHETTFGAESKLYLLWRFSQRLSILAGIKMVFGSYPFGNQTHIMPIADLLWSF